MSAPRHAKPTLVRLFNNGERVANILVNDWEELDGRARFTIPDDHPRADWIFDTITATAIVMESEAIEWAISRVRDIRNFGGDFYMVELISRRRKLLETQPDDAWCIKVFGVET